MRGHIAPGLQRHLSLAGFAGGGFPTNARASARFHGNLPAVGVTEEGQEHRDVANWRVGWCFFG
jgi:hypothetical protein